MTEELQSKIEFYHFIQSRGISLAAKAAPKAKKLKGKAKGDKGPVVKLDRPLVAPLCSTAKNSVENEKFYLTTAINYTNGPPHLGHAYEGITSDVICRYHRNFGRDVFFLTGSDEHGQKVEQKAQSLNKTPQEVCDMYSNGFKSLNKSLDISNDSYIRTTDPHHENLARKVWLRVREKGDIYLKPYVGWYNVHEEQYVTDLEAEKNDYKDEHGRPYEKKEEESYFFKMSKYQQQLLDHFKAHPEFCQPESRRKEILSFLSEPLLDLCISRTVCQWGVKCPEDPDYKGDKSHVMYVWFDALTNYLSGCGYLADKSDNVPDNSRYWPCNVHIIGKDITRFHCVYWPCMLMSAGIPLPKSVFGHGFVNDKNGMKMSKSLGNVIDPVLLVKKFPVDAIRFYIAREATYGTDLPFNEEAMIALFNAVHASGIGNLCHRSTSLCQSYCNGKIPSEPAFKLDGKYPFDLQKDLIEPFESAMSIKGEFQIQIGAEKLTQAINAANKFLQDAAPWKIKDKNLEAQKRAIVRTVLETVYIIAHFLEPFSPIKSVEIFDKLGVEKTQITKLSPNFDNLPPGTSTFVGDVLYEVIEANAAKSTEKKEVKKKDTKKKGGKEKSGKGAQKQKGGNNAPAGEGDMFYKVDIRVGKIVKVWNHEAAEKLFCECIDVGEDKPREIASGLRPFYSLEEMENRLVLAICNLKPANLVGFKSHGMVLCAANDAHDKVEFMEPPEGSKIGERVFLEGDNGENLPDPASANAVSKKKIFKKVAEDLVTNADCEGAWKSKRIVTSAGVCKAKSLVGVHLS